MEHAKRNNSVDIFRYVCALLVLTIHTAVFSEYNSNVSFFITNILSRIAVPFFFAVSGYYYIGNLRKNRKVFWPFLKRIGTIYLLWSGLYYLIAMLVAAVNRESLLSSTLSFLINFLLFGSVDTLWFIPALVYAAAITTVFYRIHIEKTIIPVSIVLYLIGCLGVSYHEIGIKIPILKSLYSLEAFDFIRHVLLMGVPFFCCGSFLYDKQEGKLKLGIINHPRLLLLLAGVAFLIEIVFVLCMKLSNGVVITVFLMPLVICLLDYLLQNPLPGKNEFGKTCRILANFTYFAHPLFVNALLFLGKHVVGNRIAPTLSFFIVFLSTLLGGLIIRKLDNRIINKWVM